MVALYGIRKTTKLGPFAEADGRINAAGQALLTEWLAEHPHPVSLLRSKWNGFTTTAVGCLGEDEVNTACLEGCCRAVLTFDPSLGFGFPGYALHWMRAAVKTELFHAGVYDRHGRPIAVGDARRPAGEGLTAASSPAVGRVVENLERWSEVERAMRGLQLLDRDRAAFRLCAAGVGQSEIAARCGRSRAWVGYVRGKVIAEVRDYLRCA